MKTFAQLAATGALALFAYVAAAGNSPAFAANPGGHYCLNSNEGGTDCGFISLAQCNATAEGIGAECSVDYADQPRPMPQPHAFR